MTETDGATDTDTTPSTDREPAADTASSPAGDSGQTALAAYQPDSRQPPADACHNYADCGNTAPGPNDTCADCLDAMRAADREVDD